MIFRLFILSLVAIHFPAFGSGGSAGTAAAPAQKTGLVGSGGVEELTAQQSACAPAPSTERPWEFKAGDKPNSVAFSPDGKLLAVTNFGGTLQIFSVNERGVLHPIKGSPFYLGASLVNVRFSPRGNLLAAISIEGKLIVFSIDKEKEEITPIEGSPFAVDEQSKALEFSPDGSLMVVSNDIAQRVTVYSVVNETIRFKSYIPVNGRPWGLTFSPNGKLLAIASLASSTISLFKVENENITQQITGSPFAVGQYPGSVVFSPDGTLLAIGTSKGMYAFSVNNEGMLGQIEGSPFRKGRPSRGVAVAPNGRLIGISDINDRKISILSINNGNMLRQIQELSFEKSQEPNALAFSPDNRLLVVTMFESDTIWMYEVDPDTGAISLITGGPLKANKKEEKGKKEFGPETEVMSIPNEMGGFSIVPRNKENEKIAAERTEKAAAELNKRKVSAIKHMIAQWKKELYGNHGLEQKIELLKKWAKIAQEKQWGTIAKESFVLFQGEVKEMRRKFTWGLHNDAYDADEINAIATGIEQLETIKF